MLQLNQASSSRSGLDAPLRPGASARGQALQLCQHRREVQRGRLEKVLQARQERRVRRQYKRFKILTHFDIRAQFAPSLTFQL